MQLEQSYVVVQSLAVVVVVDVCGGNSKGLSSRTSELLGQIVVSHPHVNCIASPHNVGDTVGCSENPGLANKSSSTKILVQAVDQGHLPAPLPRGRVLTT